MNPNKVNHFSSAAVMLNRRRSTFRQPFGVKTTFNAGKLIPLKAFEILPGDTVRLPASAVIRGATPIYPVMDNAYFDIYAFFVPNRLTWDHWKEFLGENNTDYWTQKTQYVVPSIKLTADYVTDTSNNYVGSFIDYIGVPAKASFSSGSQYISALYPRGYVKIWNDWFRDENNQNPAHLYTDDTDRDVVPLSGTTYVDTAELGGDLCPVNKYHDYFTSALPAPQKHAPITLSLASGYTPVETTSNEGFTGMQEPVKYWDASTGAALGSGSLWGMGINRRHEGSYYEYTGGDFISTLYPSNLAVDGSKFDGVSVNDLRLAFQTQKFYETQARGGTRYTEILLSMFGVRSSDARLQRSEFLGGKRIPIRQQQVAQTSSTQAEGTALGDTGAFSLTGATAFLCDKSFEEHGILYIVGCVRTDHSYSQGINKQLTRRNLFDYYFPVFANIGEQPIKSSEIYADGSDGVVVNDQPFGYQEAWAEYRYMPNSITGYMRPEIEGNLAAWHYGDMFKNRPVLNDDFVRETTANIDRTLAVPSDSSHQFIADFYFDAKVSRIMPMYSVPGLIDHG